MGCAQSRAENEEAVLRCKERRNLMKEAVAERNAFAAGHSGYAVALKNMGAALSDYGHGESEIPQKSVGGGGDPPPSSAAASAMENSLPPPLPPPPPLPNFSPTPLLRAATMPEFHRKPDRRNVEPIAMAILEDEEEAVGGEGGGKVLPGLGGRGGGTTQPTSGTPLPPPSPPQTPPITPMPPEMKGVAWDYFFSMDNMPGRPSFDEDEASDENEEEDGFEPKDMRNQNMDMNHNNKGVGVEAEPKTPERTEVKAAEETPTVVKKTAAAATIAHSNTAPPEFMGRTNVASSNGNLLQILGVLDDHFLKASESAQEVSKILEANRMYYHSNFADNRGHIDHSDRVLRVITWNRSSRGNGLGGKDDLDSEEYETHATVLDKLLAWEKKLYDEVKAGELMKLEYRRKIALLNKQKKGGVSLESLEKTKAAVSHLHTRYIVDMQSLDCTVAEVNHLRDNQLYPKLVSLVNGMAKMWDSICRYHEDQLKVSIELKLLDVSHAPKETTKLHHEQTRQLWKVAELWHLQFEKLVTHQKQYIRTLNSWLKLNIIPIESSLKEKISSPPKTLNPPIQALLHVWHDDLEKLPDELAKSAIFSFAAVIKTIADHQEEEMKLKERCEETHKEYMRKKHAFEDWYQKHRRAGHDEMHDVNSKDPVSERQFVVDSLKKRLEEEVEVHQRHCLQVREKSLGTLKTRLPEIFRAMLDYANACSIVYQKLKYVSPQPQNPNVGSS